MFGTYCKSLSVVERVFHDRKVPAQDKVVSVADPSASFIAKGGRDTVVGNRPQLGRSGKGCVT
jgi:hypothetical protein